jgi:Arc-like DNA binding domain
MNAEETLVAFRLPVSLRDDLRRRAEANERTLSQEIRSVLKRELERPSAEPRS